MTGIKISKPGVNVQSANPYDFNLNSKYPMFSIYAVFSGTVTDINEQVLTTHNLGRVPMVLAWTTVWGGASDQYILHTNSTVLATNSGRIVITDTNVTLYDSSAGLKYYGYVFENLSL